MVNGQSPSTLEIKEVVVGGVNLLKSLKHFENHHVDKVTGI